MATIGGKLSGHRHPSLRGRYIIDTWRGKIRIRSWPKKATKAQRKKAAPQQEWFRQANILAQYAPASDQIYAREVTEGTAFMPRDIFLAAMAGRMATAIEIDGQWYYSMAVKRDVSELLDVIGREPGTLIYRGEEYWHALKPGAPGHVLTSQGTDKPPAWQGGGGGTVAATLLHKTQDSPMSSTWPKFPAFDEAAYDDLNVWNPETPDRIYVPPSATRVRISALFAPSPDANSRTWFYAFYNDQDTRHFPGKAALSHRRYSIGYNNNEAMIQTAWIPANQSAYYRLFLNVASPSHAAIQAGTWAMIEAI